jgi:hypothetical protein
VKQKSYPRPTVAIEEFRIQKGWKLEVESCKEVAYLRPDAAAATRTPEFRKSSLPQRLIFVTFKLQPCQLSLAFNHF